MERGASRAVGSAVDVTRAWAVHALTASGAVVGLLALLAVARGDLRGAGLWMLLALVIDGVDGALARRAQVRRFVPHLDGRRLDDIVDYLNYVVVPAFFMTHAGLLPHWSFAALPLLASAYGFSQDDAKTEDHFFLGFPSYWNVVALYAWKLDVSSGVVALWLVGLSLAVFVPNRYVYPSRMTRFARITNRGAAIWVVWFAAAIAWPRAFRGVPAIELSLLYPAWYIAVSVWLGGWLRRRAS